MTRRSRADLWGCVRLVKVPSSIGIPVYWTYNSNSLWIPETDGDFRITRFLLLSPDSGFAVTNEIPPGIAKRRMILGDHAPLPFWIEDKLHAVQGGAYPSEVPDLAVSSSQARQVLADVRQALDDARNGRFKQRLYEDEAERITSAFPDIFVEQPVHSKYWVSRYRVAVAQARAETEPPHPIDAKLLEAGREWLKRFGSKTDYTRMKALLGQAREGIFSQVEIKNLLFAFIVDRIERDQIPEIVRWVLKDREFIVLFPAGIYGYYLQTGWPNAPFSYAKPKELLDKLFESVRTSIDRPEILGALRSLAYVYFGNNDAPDHFNRALFPFRQGAAIAFSAAAQGIRELEKEGRGARDEKVQSYAVSLIHAFDQLNYLEGIDFAATRFAKAKRPILGIPTEYIDNLREPVRLLTESRQLQAERRREEKEIEMFRDFSWADDENEPPETEYETN